MTDVTRNMQEALSRLPRTDSYSFESHINHEYTKRHIALSLLPGTLLYALHRAREAQELAVSYRGFRVGAAVVALTVGAPRFQVMTGINVKPDEGSAMNVHAEQVALQKARDRAYNAVSMVVVVGKTQEDKQSGKPMHTLHPCGLCRNVMDSDPLIISEATLIVSATPKFQTIELFSLNALKLFHDTDDDSGITRFEFPDLALFEPVPTTGTTILEDTPEILAEEAMWDATIGEYLRKRRDALLR